MNIAPVHRKCDGANVLLHDIQSPLQLPCGPQWIDRKCYVSGQYHLEMGLKTGERDERSRIIMNSMCTEIVQSAPCIANVSISTAHRRHVLTMCTYSVTAAQNVVSEDV